MRERDAYLCPVCGYDDLLDPPWDNDSPSDEICPSCGTHFGYDDVAGGDAARRGALYRTRRQKWVAQGFPWFSRSMPPPTGWDPTRQLSVFDGER